MTRKRLPGHSFEELRQRFLDEKPPKWVSKVSLEGFPRAAEQEHARYHAWLAERGGLSREELLQKAKAGTKFPAGKKGKELLDQMRADEIEKAFANWWRLQQSTPAPIEEIAEKLVVIHDEMTPDMLVTLIGAEHPT